MGREGRWKKEQGEGEGREVEGGMREGRERRRDEGGGEELRTHTGSSAVHGVLHLQLGTPHTPQHMHTHTHEGVRSPLSHASPF